MTISRRDQDQNLRDAVLLMMHELGDGWFGDLFVDADDPKYGNILKTTWRKLSTDGFVTDHGLNRFCLTSEGWFQGVGVLGLLEDQAFHDKMSKLSATLKGYVKGRTQDALVGVHQVSADSGLTVGFVRNAISSNLLDRVFGIEGAYFPPDDDMEGHIAVPLNFGCR